MRVLVLGGSGMLGHAVARELRSDFDVWTTDRGRAGQVSRWTGVPDKRVFSGFDVKDRGAVERALATSRPEWVINCIGLVKQSPRATDVFDLTLLNVELPRTLARLGQAGGFRLLHVSTDCVFSGLKESAYVESDVPDAQDPYGRTKALGELDLADALIVRTSCVGPELYRTQGLLEWLLAQPSGPVPGYGRAIWSGLPTVSFARLVKLLVASEDPLSGLYHVGANAIDKASLLSLISNELGSRWQVEVVDEPRINRSLATGKLHRDSDLVTGTWPDLVDDLVADLRAHDRS